MSKDIVIQEGGVSKRFSDVGKIRTAQAAGGSADWIPESSARTGPKTITRNGNYRAALDGLYGFDSVTVDVPTSEIKPDTETEIESGESSGGYTLWVGTLEQYAGIESPSQNTIYMIITG